MEPNAVDNILPPFSGRKPFQSLPNFLYGHFKISLLEVALNSARTKLGGIITFTGDFSNAMPSTLHPKSVSGPITR